ncbi:NAD+ synthase [Natronogracilivirga saccharolytica]|uniref:Glutamine-dependent NAD(+) synthetase n=1 Tax=Natronogracilivirga saccharolytica TaxID=2812953 RepID=A0A8J7UVH2_9BACT|nr:NAD+ synthase [Natronogracilivirga saccharolytica]MBP3191169.1 NAD+ synthase [Natronogracilivirga saccharolytica]
MNIRIQQINVVVGDIKSNADAVLRALEKAEADSVDLLVLPELVVCGYPPMDLLERRSFLNAVFSQNDRIIESTGSTGLLFGTVTPNESGHGRPIYNTAILAHQGETAGRVHKTLLPTYDVFDEFRYFEPGNNIHVTEWAGFKWGITICEDIWNNQNEYNYHTYKCDPAVELREKGAQVLINIAASPFTKRKPEMREDMLARHARRLNIPVIYANQVGANTEIVFDGISSVFSAEGNLITRLATFEEDHGDFTWSGSPDISYTGSSVAPIPGTEERLFHALVLGLKDYVVKSGMPDRVVMGLSGGIDSALAAVIATRALGKENVMGVTMPSEFSSSGSVTDSEVLASNLGIPFYELPIADIYQAFISTLQPVFGDSEFGVAEENLQSRARGALLMGISNKLGNMLLNTGNKSELAVGYCTLYGDMAGGLSILSDIYKTEVYAISRWLNDQFFGREIIPENTISKPPSAELRPDQKDTDSLPPYDILDGILKAYIEDQMPAEHIVQKGYHEETVRDVIRKVDGNEYKRRQAAPGIRVSSKAFGSGRRLPIAQRWTELG